ncbi:carbohydrate ABC transporter permease [Vallitalea sp.]|jgi:multiple sugar transport system permease protein|uniref:carbohydrate ABC transporter permease n=1 Tax=Vallitalea sp. TaxID=1882829 RepID=UPI003FCDDAE4
MNKATKAIIYISITIICLLTLLPLIWMLSASLKLDKDVFSIPIQWIPHNPQWKNYIIIWDKIPFALFVFNTTKLTIIITLIQLFTSSFAAYGFAKCKFKGRDILFLCYIATIAIPWQVYMLPQYSMMNKFGLIDTHLSIILLQSFTAFGVFLIRQFYLSIPNELLEAGRIDGMTEYGIYFKIILPLSKPALSTLTIFSFVGVWNDFMGPMIYFNSEHNKTIQLGIRMFISQYSADYSLIMAASVISLIPVFIIFIAFQRFFVEGVATSGLKA